MMDPPEGEGTLSAPEKEGTDRKGIFSVSRSSPEKETGQILIFRAALCGFFIAF